MVDFNDREDDARFRAFFGGLVKPVEDAGFAAVVMKRIRRRKWQRGIVLLAALVPGLLLGVRPIIRYILDMTSGFSTIATRWMDPSWVQQYEVILIAVVIAAVFPVVMHTLEK